jgi:hypothetical protein
MIPGPSIIGILKIDKMWAMALKQNPKVAAKNKILNHALIFGGAVTNQIRITVQIILTNQVQSNRQSLAEFAGDECACGRPGKTNNLNFNFEDTGYAR